MANARRPIPPLRAYTAAVLGVFALFVISAGAGMASWSIVVLGVALMIIAVSMVVVSAMRGGARAYVAGTAHVVSASKPPASSVYGRCELHLIVDAPGVANAAVTIRDPRVPVAKWPDGGTTLPIMVAMDDPRRVRIQWDDVSTHAEAAGEDQLASLYAEDYSDEYPEYAPPDPGTADGAAPGPADRTARGTAEWAAADRAAPGTAQRVRADRGGPATADLMDELADLHEDQPATPVGAPAEAGTARRPAPPAPPPAPRRPEASPETPEDAYPVDGEPVFSPKVPPAPDQAGSVPGAADAPPSDDSAEGPPARDAEAAPTAEASHDAEAAPTAEASHDAEAAPTAEASHDARAAQDAEAQPAPPAAAAGAQAGPPAHPSGMPMNAGRAPRPRPRPHRDDQAQTREGAPAGATRSGVMTADDAVPEDTGMVGASTQDEEGVESHSTPSVTAIEFDLGQLITAYPSARPGRAGEIHGVGITVPVRDLARSADFYRDVLGFYEIDGGDGNIVLASGDTRVVLSADPDAPPADHHMVHINLEVADVDAVYEELKAKGVRFTSGPRPTAVGARLEPWAATFRDPDGHDIAITQWRRRETSG